ncbi:MAG: glycoside hydrolase family 3 N-terminal domain-containing protein [Acidobacteriota bacterium]
MVESQEDQPDIDGLIARLTLDEKVEMLSGGIEFWTGLRGLADGDLYHKRGFPAAGNERLGIPGLCFIDGPRGVVIFGGATTFPATMARGATWNPEIESQIGDALGKELRLLGGNLTGAVCINLLRHPAWGRAQETYGEDTHHLGAMGSALTAGIQKHAIACVKHFALNSMENARFKVDVTIDDRALHEVYLPHFKACVDAGAQSFMSAYNSVNGEWAGQNKTLLTDILKRRWGFEGFVLTDFIFGVRDAAKAIDAGLDLEMPFPMVWGPKLQKLVAKGEVAESLLDGALRRLIRPRFELASIEDYDPEWLGCEAHQTLAREAAVQAITLLRNEPVKGTPALPLPPSARVVVLGELADQAVLGDRGSSDGRPDYSVSALAGIRAAGTGGVAHFDNPTQPGAADAIGEADAVLVVVGNTHLDEGEYVAPLNELQDLAPLFPPPPLLRKMVSHPFTERIWTGIVTRLLKVLAFKEARKIERDKAAFGKGGDRRSLRLKTSDEELIAAACAAHERVIVALIGGSAITMEAWKNDAEAILMFWYAGQEGGHALADIVFGARNPSGRLPFSIPTDEAHLPFFDPDATKITYDLWHGYRKLGRDGHAPAFPFGFGLAYTTFVVEDLTAHRPSYRPTDTVRLTATVANTGSVDGALVLQIYAEVLGSAVERAPRELKAFQRAHVAAGDRVEITIDLPVERLAYFDTRVDDFIVEATDYRLYAAQHSADADAPSVDVRVTS